MIQRLTSAATITVPAATVENRTEGIQIFQLTPLSDATLNAVPDGIPGAIYAFIIDSSGVTSRTLTWGANFRSTATLATGTTDARRFVINFVSDGVILTEMSRTAAQA